MNGNTLQLVINGQVRDHDLAVDTQFEEIMKEVNRIVHSPGITITRVNLDGKDITGADWDGFDRLTAGEISSLEVETGAMDELVTETLNSLSQFLDQVIKELQRAVELFRLSEDLKAFEVYGSTLEGIQLINYLTPMIHRNLGLNGGSNGGTGSIEEQTSKLEGILVDMLSSQESSDWILLTDLIEYELVPHLENRQSTLALWRAAPVV